MVLNCLASIISVYGPNMDLITFAKDIETTFWRTVKFREDGKVGHTLDRDVFRVIAVAVAADILDKYKVKPHD